MKAVYGLYRTPESAGRAFEGLRRLGLSASDITVMSSEPLEEYEFGRQDHRTAMPWIAVMGAALGLTGAYFLTSLTQQSWPIRTGGMPTVTNWTNIIIMFESTMLGAVLATTLTLLTTARLPSRLPEIYDPAVSDGMILVGIANPAESRTAQLEEALRSAGPETFKTL